MQNFMLARQAVFSVTSLKQGSTENSLVVLDFNLFGFSTQCYPNNNAFDSRRLLHPRTVHIHFTSNHVPSNMLATKDLPTCI